MYRVRGTIEIAPDKSISHRAIMLSSIANGKNVIRNFLTGADCLSSIECFRQMGVDIDMFGDEVVVHGKGMRGLQKPKNSLYVGNSGTTIRLMMGILAGQNFQSMISGDASISKRPMRRVTSVLKDMGAVITGKDDGNYTPIMINGGSLNGLNYKMQVASAQVKSAIILASLYACNNSRIIEKVKSRNHTELMLKSFGANITVEDLSIYINPTKELYPSDVTVPGDISSAAFFIGCASVLKGSELLIKNVGINETRSGILKVLEMMGGNFEIINKKVKNEEEIADILVRYSNLNACKISSDIIPYLIDEIPIIALMATQASGQTIIKDASELRVKECDRIKAMVLNLKSMGADIVETQDGMIINGPCKLKGVAIKTFDDHRIAMTFLVASLLCDIPCKLDNTNCIDISFPGFKETLKQIIY